MQYFTEQYLDFMAELAVNNNKAWFDDNRKRYEQHVREPFKLFITDLIQAIQILRPDIDLPAHKALFRINRDIRFTHDKTPYKTSMSAYLNPSKHDSQPGFYISLGIEDGLTLAGGMHSPGKETIQNIRSELNHDNSRQLLKLANKKSFSDNWGEIKGNKNKRLPKEFSETAKQNRLLYNKQWYFWTDLPFEKATSDNLMDAVMGYFKTAHPINEYFKSFVVPEN
jgi:uncharacterized protein (TIGR02453 family)